MPITAAGLGGSSIPAIMDGISQDVPYNAAGGANSQSLAFGPKTTLIEIAAHVTGTGIRIKCGQNPDATTGGKLLPGSGTWFSVVNPGWKIAVVSDDSNTGYINVTEALEAG